MPLTLVRAAKTAERPKPPRRQPITGRKHITPEEFKALLRAIRENSLTPTRDALLVTLMYRHGLRISEAVAVTWDDVQLGRAGSIYIARRKGSQSGTHTLDTDELRMLREVQREQERNGRESRFVFVSKRRTPLAVRTAREFITDAARAAGLPVTNPHALRHAAGARLINKGYDVRHVQQYLGHKDIRNTAKYTELSPHALAGMERD